MFSFLMNSVCFSELGTSLKPGNAVYEESGSDVPFNFWLTAKEYLFAAPGTKLASNTAGWPEWFDESVLLELVDALDDGLLMFPWSILSPDFGFRGNRPSICLIMVKLNCNRKNP